MDAARQLCRRRNSHEDQPKPPPTERFLKLSDVTRQVGLGKTFVYNEVQAGRFPRPVKIGARASRWRLSDINKWMDEQG